MAAKYYTPEIQEFHIGFEYEFQNKDEFPSAEWIQSIIKDGTQIDDIHNSIYNLRCKCLDKEDIESFGFEVKSDYGAGTTFLLHNWTELSSVKHSGITYSEFSIEICELGLMNDRYKIFKGDIKNKSELKRILFQTGII